MGTLGGFSNTISFGNRTTVLGVCEASRNVERTAPTDRIDTSTVIAGDCTGRFANADRPHVTNAPGGRANEEFSTKNRVQAGSDHNARINTDCGTRQHASNRERSGVALRRQSLHGVLLAPHRPVGSHALQPHVCSETRGSDGVFSWPEDHNEGHLKRKGPPEGGRKG